MKVELPLVRRTPPSEPLHFHYTSAGIRSGRIAGLVLVVVCAVGMLAAQSAPIALAVLPVGIAGVALLLRVRRRLASRPSVVTVDPDGLMLAYASGDVSVLAWGDIVSIGQRWLRRELFFGMRSGSTHRLDTDLDEFAQFLHAVTLHVDASRRWDETGVIRLPRAGVFHRPAHDQISAVLVAACGIVFGLVARPGLFLLTALAVPRLVWRWLTDTQCVIVGDKAVTIVRPLSREVIPLRAIRDIAFAAHGTAVDIVIDHHERGYITLTGLDAAALPLFDAVLDAMRHAGRQRTTYATRADSPRHAPVLAAGAVLIGLVATAWVTILTGLPLRTAVRYSNDIVAHTALLLGTPRNVGDRHGLTALHHAAMRNDVALVRLLLAHGADIDARSRPNAHTPLHKAVDYRAVDAVTALLERGASVDARTRSGLTPLAFGLNAGEADAEIIARILLDAGADPHSVDEAGRTPLHYAARRGHSTAIALLAKRGARLQPRDTAGSTPLYLAARHGHQAAMAALLDAGADVDAPAWRGRTVLALAASDSTIPLPVLDLLLAARARVDVPGDDGWNAVQLAVHFDHVAALEAFARIGAPLDATSGDVAPALWIAIRKNNEGAVRALLRGRADPYRQWRGYTAHDLARHHGNGTISALLRTRGAPAIGYSVRAPS